MTAEEQKIMNMVRDIFDAGYKYNPANNYDLQPFTNKIKKIMNQHTTSIIKQAVREELENNQYGDHQLSTVQESTCNRILSRIKTEIGDTK